MNKSKIIAWAIMLMTSSSSFAASNYWESPEENEAQWQLLRKSKIEQLERDAIESTRRMEEERRLLREHYETRQWRHDNPEAAAQLGMMEHRQRWEDMKRRLDAD